MDDREYLADHVKSPAYSGLIQEVEVRLNNPVEDGNPFCFRSRLPLSVLAGKMVAFLVQLDRPPTCDDILSAINDEVLSGLKQLSWGLLLSDRYLPRFKFLVRKHQHRRLNPHGPDFSLQPRSGDGVAHRGHRLLLDALD